MTSLLDPDFTSDKAIFIGESGVGKTGALVSLVCGGYVLRIIDTDKGVRVLRGLLTNPHYPYSKILQARNIDLATAVDFHSIDNPMEWKTINRVSIDETTGKRRAVTERIAGPKNALAWAKIHELLESWPGAGHIESWEPNVVLVIDSLTTASQNAYYYQQQLQNRLGQSEDGYDYQRDVGGAQSQVRRLLEAITVKEVRCKVIVIGHIVRVDTQAGYAASPNQRARNRENIDPRGYPATLGVALSPKVGIRFNDTYIVKRTGSGGETKRFISTRPVDNVEAKTSNWLEPEYPVTSGMYEIFTTLSGQEVDKDLVKAMRGGEAAARPSGPPPAFSIGAPPPPPSRHQPGGSHAVSDTP